MPMSDENKKKASDRMRQMQADKKERKQMSATDSNQPPNTEMGDTIYFCKSGSYTLGNFKAEERYPNGAVKSREVSLRFHRHTYIAKTQEEKDHIENTEDFKRGFITIISMEKYTRMIRDATVRVVNVEQSNQTIPETVEAIIT